MKKTQRKDAIRNVKKRVVSFLSICLVSALGLAALFTTHYMAAGIDKTANEYYERNNFKDYEMVSSTGISQANVDKIASAEGVSDAEGVIEADGSLVSGDTKLSVTVLSMTESVSVPELVEGRNPVGRDECMIGEDVAEISGLKTGDKVRLSLSGLDALGDESPLYSKEFTITGLMHHPDHFRRKSTNTVVLPAEAFNEEATHGLFTRVFIKAEAPDVSVFKDKYFDELSGTTKRLEDLAEELEADRTAEMKEEAYAEIDEEWAKAEAELADGEKQIADGEAALDSELAAGRDKLNSAQKKLNSKIAEYEKQIKEGKKKVAEAKKYIALIDENLPAVKKYIEEMKARYSDDIDEALDLLAKAQKLLDKLSGLDPDSEEFKAVAKELAQFVVDKQDTIRKVNEFFKDDTVKELAEKLKKKTKIDMTGLVYRLGDGFDADSLIQMAQIVIDNEGDIPAFAESMKAYIADIEQAIKTFEKYEDYIAKYEANRSSYIKQIKDFEKEIAAAEKKLKAEKKKYQNKIKAGWAEYYAQKAKYEAKLEEAKALLEENRELAEEKLAEAKAEVEGLYSNWILLDKKANAGYVDVRANINSIKSAGLIMGILFMLITAVVCFSTLVIIIDEQREMVGTTKAFGFFKSEVLAKYLSFGFLASLAGCVIGIIVSLIAANIVQGIYYSTGMYQMGRPSSIVLPGLTAVCSLALIAITCLASVVSCTDILRSPASLLMKGAVLKKERKKKSKEKTNKRGGSLYSRLIVRNMKDDKARVLVTIAIVAASCLMIGVGISIKLAYDGMVDKQMNEINKYDLRVTMGDEVTDEQATELAKTLRSEGVDYLPASVETRLYDWDGRIDGLKLICADTEKLGDYIAVTDSGTKEEIKIPESGILIQKRMHESYDMDRGDTLPVLDPSLNVHEAKIEGYFTNYVGRTVIASPAAYKEIFGKDFETNSFFLKLNGADAEAVEDKLYAVTEDISVEANGDFANKFSAVKLVFNIVVVIVLAVAILMSFMILTNLANIYLTRKKTELSIMRVNGFSIKEAKGYLSKESILTTVIGIALGVLGGAVFAPYIIGPLQQPDLEFVKSFQPVAWLIAAGLEGIFALMIYSYVFRKVKDLNLKDIA